MTIAAYAPVKQCPRCLWMLAADARVCTHCGLRFAHLLEVKP